MCKNMLSNCVKMCPFISKMSLKKPKSHQNNENPSKIMGKEWGKMFYLPIVPPILPPILPSISPPINTTNAPTNITNMWKKWKDYGKGWMEEDVRSANITTHRNSRIPNHQVAKEDFLIILIIIIVIICDIIIVIISIILSYAPKMLEYAKVCNNQKYLPILPLTGIAGYPTGKWPKRIFSSCWSS